MGKSKLFSDLIKILPKLLAITGAGLTDLPVNFTIDRIFIKTLKMIFLGIIFSNS